MVARPKTARGPAGAKGHKSARRKSGQWSGAVTRRSNALDLEKSVFTSSDPRKIARSLKRSAERSKRRKSAPYRSAMSRLTFYLNRAGWNLPKRRVRILERAKGELRKVFGRESRRRDVLTFISTPPCQGENPSV